MPDKVGAPSGAPDGQIDRGGAAKARAGAAKARGEVTQGPPPETYRSPLALLVWWVWLAFAVANLIDIAVQGRDRLSLEAAAALVLVTGIMYVGALRPRVIATARGIVVRNPLRDHRVPWTSVSSVDVRDLLRVHCAWPEPGSESRPNKGQGQQAVHRPENVQRTRIVQAWALQSARRAGVRPSVSRYELARRSVGGAAAAAEPPGAVHRKETERIARALSERARRQRADAMTARPGAAAVALLTGIRLPEAWLTGASLADRNGHRARSRRGTGPRFWRSWFRPCCWSPRSSRNRGRPRAARSALPAFPRHRSAVARSPPFSRPGGGALHGVCTLGQEIFPVGVTMTGYGPPGSRGEARFSGDARAG